MDFNRPWTQFALDAEVESFGTARIVKAHAALRADLAPVRASLARTRSALGRLHGLMRAGLVGMRSELDGARKAIDSGGAGAARSMIVLACNRLEALDAALADPEVAEAMRTVENKETL